MSKVCAPFRAEASSAAIPAENQDIRLKCFNEA